MPIEIVIDGTDGAGKTSFVNFLLKKIRTRSLTVDTVAPYREQEVYPLWEQQPLQAAKIINGIIEAHRIRLQHLDCIVWDRGWPTAFVSTDNATARDCFNPLPTTTILLLGSTQKTRAKALQLNSPGEWVSDDALIDYYNIRYHALPQTYQQATLACYHDTNGLFEFELIWEQILPAFST